MRENFVDVPWLHPSESIPSHDNISKDLEALVTPWSKNRGACWKRRAGIQPADSHIGLRAVLVK